MPKPAKGRDGVYQRKGQKGYWISFVDETGKRRQQYGGPTPLQARDAREDLRSRARKAKEAIAHGEPVPTTDTFAVLINRFLDFQRKRCRTAQLSKKDLERQEGIIAKHLIPFFGKMKLANIQPTNVYAYVEARTGEVSAATIAKECAVLKRFLTVASTNWNLISKNPTRGVEMPELPGGRTRHLAPAELQKLLVACPAWLRPIAGLAVATGCRRGELMRIRWADVDIQRGRILLELTKNGEPRFAYLNQLSRQVIDGLERGQPKDLLFPGVTPWQVTDAFIRACKAAGIEDFSLHDLRHTFASQLRINGADLHTVGQLLGHKDLRMTARYSHLSPNIWAPRRVS